MVKYDIDLVFSGSGVRLPAHVGALKAIVGSGLFNIKRIAGVSGGAIIGAAFECFRQDLIDINAVVRCKDLIMNTDIGSLIKDSYFPLINLLRKCGMYSGDKFKDFVANKISKKTLRELPDIYIVTHDLIKRASIVQHASTFPTLDIPTALRRSMGIPFYFFPNYRRNRDFHCYVDGGVSNNYPIDIFDDKIRPTIGIRLYSDEDEPDAQVCDYGLKDYSSAIISAMIDTIEYEHIEDAHWASTISINTGKIKSTNFNITQTQKEILFNNAYAKTVDWLSETDLNKLPIL